MGLKRGFWGDKQTKKKGQSNGNNIGGLRQLITESSSSMGGVGGSVFGSQMNDYQVSDKTPL
jgi:hypothetical protein